MPVDGIWSTTMHRICLSTNIWISIDVSALPYNLATWFVLVWHNLVFRHFVQRRATTWTEYFGKTKISSQEITSKRPKFHEEIWLPFCAKTAPGRGCGRLSRKLLLTKILVMRINWVAYYTLLLWYRYWRCSIESVGLARTKCRQRTFLVFLDVNFSDILTTRIS